MTPPRRRALLVGIDRYENLAGHAQLRSCANDAQLMAEVLVNHHAFRSEDVTLLLDEAATRDGMLAGLAALRRRARPGDAVVFYFSGHGSQAPDSGGDEPDGWDETLVPHDSGRNAAPNRDIIDDEIYDWLLGMSEVTRNVAVIADTCFAGGATRGGRDKWIERDPRPRRAPPPPSPPAAPRRSVRSGSRDAGPSGFLPLDERYVLLAACRADEHARELKSQPLSVFTFFLCQELVRTPAATTYRELIERVRLAVAGEVRGQTPQVEGARDRVLFGEAAATPELFLPVLDRQGRTVELGGGAVHGVDRGSVWAVHPAGTRRPVAERVTGLVRIERVEAVRSRGTILEEAAPIAAGARAFEHARGPGWLRLSVALPRGGAGGAREPRDATLAAALHRSRLLREAEDGETAAVRIAAASPAIESVAESGDESASRAVRIDEPSWIALDLDGELLLPPLPRARPDAVASLVRGLEDLARARNLLAVEPGAGHEEALDARLEIDLLRSRGDGPYETATADAGGEVIFHEGDRLGLRVTHHGSRPLYLHVLDIGLLGAVSLIYPVRGANKLLAPGLPFEIGTHAGHALTVRIPADLEARARAAGEPRIEGREALKLFLTSGEADLSGWQQSAHRGTRGASRSSAGAAAAPRPAAGRLAALLGQALGAAPTRSGLPAPSPLDRWTTRTVSFLVRRAPCYHRA
jgi:hypothetical protein